MLLSPYRVIDVTDERGQLAAQMLAQLGADVIAIEPPGGARSRRLAPFAGDVDGSDNSLIHRSFNRGKRSVVADPSSDVDRERLRALLAGADVLFDHGPGGLLDAAGLDAATLAELNPALVHVSITPFGLDGPKAEWVATDLTVWASGGPLILTGDTDRPPVPVGVPQAFGHASAEAAGAALVALTERVRSGVGQRVDVSAQQCVGQATQCAILSAPNRASTHQRTSGGVKLGPIDMQLMWPCKDGFVSITFLFGSALGVFTRRFMEWIHEEGFCDQATLDKDWIGYGAALVSGAEPVEAYEEVKRIVGRFCATKTKQELVDGAMARTLLVAPVLSVGDVVASEQFESRGYWDHVDGVKYPGPFGQTTHGALPRLPAPAKLSAHTESVFAEPPRSPAVDPAANDRSGALPLAGLKVLDFSWVVAGPSVSRVLADYGATVVRVESAKRIETARTIQPFCDDLPGTDTSALYGSVNSGKLGLSLDLASAEGRAVALDLAAWADVVMESFSPKGMRGFGLDYEVIREINPSVIMMSSCLFGQQGPMSRLAGFGTMAAALSGFFLLTGWPDRPPCGPYGAYTDYISPRFGVALLLASLDHRRRTGEGCYLDFAQAEAALHTLTPAILECTINGRQWERRGAHDDNHAPHGVYPCAGGDYVAIACADDTQRSALASVVGAQNISALTDDAIAAWTSERSAAAAAEQLQGVRVPAHAVQNSPECLVDPQLVHRRHFLEFPHSATGTMTVEAPRARLSRTPAVVRSPGPTLGQHTEQVLLEVLGYDDERFTELLISGALE